MIAAKAGRRPERILAGAMSCFAEKGVDATTIADIRRASGASTGSIYHHFGDKHGLVAALYVELLRSSQTELLGSARRARSGEALVKALVRRYLAWVEANPAAARFLLEMRHAETVAAAESTIRADTRALFAAVWERLEGFMEAGQIRPLPRHLIASLTVGVAEAAARRWLAAGRPPGLARDARVLAEAAWRGLAPDRGGAS